MVLIDQQLKQAIKLYDKTFRTTKLFRELGDFHIEYAPKISQNGHIVADFLV